MITSKLFIVGLIIIVKFIYGIPPVLNAPIGIPVQLLQSCLVLEKVE